MLNLLTIHIYRFFFSGILVLLMGCESKEKNTLFELVEPRKSGITFINTISESDSMNVLEFMNIYTGGGVAVGDVNNDSLPDLYFSGNMVSGKLYINKSTKDRLVFEDITEAAGVATSQWISGVSMVDINQDGLLDIYACATGSKEGRNRTNQLFINQGSKGGVPSFKESAIEYGLNDTTYTTQASFFDYDRDGDLDVFLIVNSAENYYGSKVNVAIPEKNRFDAIRSDRLYKNMSAEASRGETDSRKFIDVTIEAGISSIGYSLGLAVSDVNTDGWPDIYIANDFLSNDVLYINNQDGTFTNKAAQYFKHTSYASMGVDVADYNNDKLPDIAVVDMIPEDNVRMKSMLNKTNYDRLNIERRGGYYPQFSRNTLQLNNGQNPKGGISFSEVGQLAGIHHTDWSWSILFGDYDNDGWKDLFVTNGFLRDMQDLDFIKYATNPSQSNNAAEARKQFLDKVHQLPGVKVPNYLFRNQGDLRFENMKHTWGAGQASLSNGAVHADLDNDGDLDLVINNLNDTPSLYRNTLSQQSNAAHFLKINFLGPAANKNGIGAKAEVHTKGQVQTYENYTTRGFLSNISTPIHVGLGNHAQIDSLIIIWPDGKEQVLYNIKANSSLSVDYQQATQPASRAAIAVDSILFTEVSKEHNLLYRHQENEYSDFNYQRLLPFKLTQEGPPLAVGDIDGNGLDDFYIGGAVNYPGKVFKQDARGLFQSQALEEQSTHEDMGSLFFDADNDKDLDLYIVSGSVEESYLKSPYYQDRLYINDGKGKFTRQEDALPLFSHNGSCVTAADFDKDGDLDLFVGSRSVPGSYPLPASSKILRNESKGKDQPHFTDATSQLLPALTNIGMVTSALWTDYNNDGSVDLMLVGEGMPITFFENKQGKFSKAPSLVIKDSHGYWNSIVSADFDADGDMDYVIGNMGLNSLLKASTKEPVLIYTKDFDKNGSLDPILTYFVMGKHVPFHPRDEFIDELYTMRASFTTYAKYAAATVKDIFTEEELKQAHVLTYQTFATSYLQNNGKDGFALKPLPIQAQTSPTYGMLADDADSDGITDIVMVGNSYAPNVYIGWYDASVGTVLKGKGDGTFVALKPQQSGLFADKQAKALAELIGVNNTPLVLISNNSDSLHVFRYTNKTFSSIIPLQVMDAGAYITYNNGNRVKAEFPYGAGFLSQSTRHLKVSDAVSKVRIFDYAGATREISFETLTTADN